MPIVAGISDDPAEFKFKQGGPFDLDMHHATETASMESLRACQTVQFNSV